MVLKNKIGYAIEYKAEEFIKVLNELKNNKDILNEMSNNANKLYIEKYNWDKMEKRLICEYKKLDKRSEKYDKGNY